MENKVYPNPFAYNVKEQKAYKSFYTQRESSYTEPAESVYQGNEMMAFMYNIEAPTPQLARVDGYKSKKELNEE